MAMERSVALITGASVGIGQAVALRLASQGYDIAGGSRHAERLEDTAALVRQAGSRFVPLVDDVRDPESSVRAADVVQREFGRLDVLVNNAAAGFSSPAEELSPRGFRAIVDSTLAATFWYCQAAWSAMHPRGQGVIVNMASIAALRPTRGMAVYSAAKAGVVALTRALAEEWAPEIRVVGIAPGTIETEGTRGVLSTEELRRRADAIPRKRLGHVDDIAGFVEFLVSPAADFLTGTTVLVDGGQTASVRIGG